MSVNVALCGSIPRSVMLQEQQKEQLQPQSLTAKSLGAPCLSTSLTSRLSKESLAENNRCGSDGSTHKRTVDGIPGFLSHKARETLHNNMRPVLTERPPLTQVFEAPSWAVPAKGEARLEVSIVFGC